MIEKHGEIRIIYGTSMYSKNISRIPTKILNILPKYQEQYKKLHFLTPKTTFENYNTTYLFAFTNNSMHYIHSKWTVTSFKLVTNVIFKRMFVLRLRNFWCAAGR